MYSCLFVCFLGGRFENSDFEIHLEMQSMWIRNSSLGKSNKAGKLTPRTFKACPQVRAPSGGCPVGSVQKRPTCQGLLAVRRSRANSLEEKTAFSQMMLEQWDVLCKKKKNFIRILHYMKSGL